VRLQHDMVEREQCLRHLGLVSEYVESGTAELACGQQFDQRHFVDDRAARDVDEHALRSERFEHGTADQSARRLPSGAGRDQHIDRARQRHQIGLIAPRQRLRAQPVPCDLHLERQRAPRDGLADAPHTDHAQSLAADPALQTHATLEPMPGADETIGASNAAERRQHQTDRQIGNIISQHVRRVRDRNVVGARALEVDRIDADAEAKIRPSCGAVPSARATLRSCRLSPLFRAVRCGSAARRDRWPPTTMNPETASVRWLVHAERSAADPATSPRARKFEAR
jgi:hypothetical protein